MASSLVSGMLIDGTSNVTELAERVSSNFWRGGHCGIAIANETGHTLMSPQRYACAGSINTMPLSIETGKTGVITAVKIFASPFGSDGVLSYEISTADVADLPYSTRFQLMWMAPFYLSAADNKVNVAIGNMAANEDLFERMSSDLHGQLIRARNTAHLYDLGYGFKANVYMGDKGPAPLAITLIREKKDLTL